LTPFSAPEAYLELNGVSFIKARVARAVVSTSSDFPDDLVIEDLAPETLPSLSYLFNKSLMSGSACSYLPVF